MAIKEYSVDPTLPKTDAFYDDYWDFDEDEEDDDLDLDDDEDLFDTD